jgi:hypothetical protein
MLYTIVNSAGAFGSCSQADVYLRTICAIKIPYAGNRNWSNSQYYDQGRYGFYWSSSSTGTDAYAAFFYAGGGLIAVNHNRGHAFTLRCIKN